MKQVILITGSRKGIGQWLAKYYLGRGWTVIGCSREESALQRPGYYHYKADVGDENDVKLLFQEIRNTHNQLDVLINNAGVASMNFNLLMPAETVNHIMDTNVLGTFLCSREAVKLMINKKQGRIINMSSVAVPMNLAGEAVYAASKAAVNSLTKTLAKEFAAWGITVNAVGVSPVQTDLIKNISAIKMQELLNQLPLKRLGKFEDVANVTDFFIQPSSNFITGQIIYLGGV